MMTGRYQVSTHPLGNQIRRLGRLNCENRISHPSCQCASDNHSKYDTAPVFSSAVPESEVAFAASRAGG